MDNISSDIVGIIYQLLPGFITACIFYSLTSVLRPDPFERVVQALIFTAIAKALLIVTMHILLFIGNFFPVGVWSKNVEFVVFITIAIILGIVVSLCVNNDFPLALLRKDGVLKYKGLFSYLSKYLSKYNFTNKTLHPSEWFSFFQDSNYYVILHLEKERRLRGLLQQFPDNPNDGHFIVVYPCWILTDGTIVPLTTVDKMLVNAKDVTRVELMKDNLNVTKEDIGNQNKPIYDLYNKGGSNVNKCSETVSQN